MFLVVPFLGVVATTWRTVIHAFDPDEPASALAPVEAGEGPSSTSPARQDPSPA